MAAILNANQVHIDRALTQFAIAYMQSADQFVADKVFPVVPVSKQSDKYYVFARDAFLRATAQRRAPGTRAAQKVISLSNDRYAADVWALEGYIPVETRANADDAINIDEVTVDAVVSDMLISRENEWVSTFFTTGVWGTDVTGVASAPSAGQFVRWDDGANSNPVQDVEAGRIAIWEATGFRPNAMTVSPRVHSALKKHPLILERYKYTSSDSITGEMIAAVLELERYLVAGAVKTTSVEGAAHASAFVAGKHALLSYSPGQVTGLTACAGKTFAWTGVEDANSEMGVAIDTYYEPAEKRDVVRGHMAYDMKVTGVPLGYFFSGAVA